MKRAIIISTLIILAIAPSRANEQDYEKNIVKCGAEIEREYFSYATSCTNSTGESAKNCAKVVEDIAQKIGFNGCETMILSELDDNLAIIDPFDLKRRLIDHIASSRGVEK